MVSLLWRGFHPWPDTFQVPWAAKNLRTGWCSLACSLRAQLPPVAPLALTPGVWYHGCAVGGIAGVQQILLFLFGTFRKCFFRNALDVRLVDPAGGEC